MNPPRPQPHAHRPAPRTYGAVWAPCPSPNAPQSRMPPRVPRTGSLPHKLAVQVTSLTMLILDSYGIALNPKLAEIIQNALKAKGTDK